MLYLSPILMRSAPPSPCYLQGLGRVAQMCTPTSLWDLVRSPSQTETSFLRYHSCTGKLPLWPKMRPFWPSSTSPGCWRLCVWAGTGYQEKSLGDEDGCRYSLKFNKAAGISTALGTRLCLRLVWQQDLSLSSEKPLGYTGATACRGAAKSR